MDVISGAIPNDQGEYINVPASWVERKHEVQDLEEKEHLGLISTTSTSIQSPTQKRNIVPSDGYMLLDDEENQQKLRSPLIFLLLVQFAVFLKRGFAQQYKQPATIAFDFLLVLVIGLAMGLIFSNLSFIDAPSPTQFAHIVNTTSSLSSFLDCTHSQLLLLTLSNAMLIPLADEICKQFISNSLGLVKLTRQNVRSSDFIDDARNFIGRVGSRLKGILARKGSLLSRMCLGRLYCRILFGKR